MAAVNIRCLDGVDLDAVPVQHYDGLAAGYCGPCIPT